MKAPDQAWQDRNNPPICRKCYRMLSKCICHSTTHAAEIAERRRFEAHAAERKATPIASGVLDYFPDALRAVAKLSKIGNDQHNPGKPLHWDRSKSTDEADCLMRHFMERGTIDTDGVRHSAKVAWRALALLQKEIEAATRRP